MNAPYGSYIVFGPALEPEVHLLTDTAAQRFSDGCALGITKEHLIAEHYEQTFCAGARYAIPAWNEQALLILAEHYVGYHQEKMRLAASCIVTHGYYSTQPQDKGGGEGGQKANLVPRRPIKPRPGGSVFTKRPPGPPMTSAERAAAAKLNHEAIVEKPHA